MNKTVKKKHFLKVKSKTHFIGIFVKRQFLSEPVFVNFLGAQKLIPNLAESIPGLHKRLQIRAQKKTQQKAVSH
jgi:hypothetical protein